MQMVFQPQIDIKSSPIIGRDALWRWTSTALGDVSSSQFIPLAERTGPHCNKVAGQLDYVISQRWLFYSFSWELMYLNYDNSLHQPGFDPLENKTDRGVKIASKEMDF